MRRPHFFLLCLLVGTSFLAAAATVRAQPSGKPSCKTAKLPKLAARPRKAPKGTLDARKHYDVVVETSCGSFAIRLDQKTSPHLAASWVALVQSGFFDKTVFHRIVPGFVVQGGDPTATGSGGPGYLTVDALPRTFRYRIGDVAMAKAGNEPSGTSGSQFFLITGPNGAALPPDYAFLGRITSGLDVALLIGTQGDPSTELPTRIILITKMTVKES